MIKNCDQAIYIWRYYFEICYSSHLLRLQQAVKENVYSLPMLRGVVKGSVATKLYL